jgi:hypothetical protein
MPLEGERKNISKIDSLVYFAIERLLFTQITVEFCCVEVEDYLSMSFRVNRNNQIALSGPYF